jgi:hypothetical protein
MVRRETAGAVQEQQWWTVAIVEKFEFDAGDRDGCALQGTSSCFGPRG